MKRLIAVLLSIIAILGLSFAGVVLFVYVITWCFGFTFSWKIAVGAWMLLALLKFWFTKSKE